MSFNQESLQTLQEKSYANYTSRLKAINETPRHSILKVLASIDAGIQHQNMGDLSFLADQLFPDTAEGKYLRLHWSDKVPPLYATTAVGTVRQGGVQGSTVPLGLIYASASGKRYFTTSASVVGIDGFASVRVTASESGAASNLGAEQDLTIASSLASGIESKAKTADGGIAGGVEGETDEEYLARVLLYLRNTTRYGKPGDFSAWAVDASAEVSKAFEIKNFGIFGALLIQVISGNQIDGVRQVGNLEAVWAYVMQYAPPIQITIRTPELILIEPSIGLQAQENTIENRNLVKNRLQVFLSARAEPGVSFTQGLLQSIIIDGVTISSATLVLPVGKIETTVLQYPILGNITWL